MPRTSKGSSIHVIMPDKKNTLDIRTEYGEFVYLMSIHLTKLLGNCIPPFDHAPGV